MEWNKLVYYDEGELRWLNDTKYLKLKGKIVGTLKKSGYKEFLFSGKYYRVHRVIWELHYGKIPEGLVIDHIDQNKSNNRIENLRLATTIQNSHNSGVRLNNKLKVKGVHFHKNKNKYQAQIMHEGKTRHLGHFKTLEEAKEAYEKAAKELHGEYYNGII